MAIGGLVGSSTGTILDSASSASVTVSASSGRVLVYAGGLVGTNVYDPNDEAFGNIESSYATGNVSVAGTAVQGAAGGLVGENEEYEGAATISNCYAIGSVSGPATGDVGGLVGTSTGAITTSYSTGAPGGGASVGGLLGFDGGSTLFGNIWDTTTSGITNPAQGAGNVANDPGIAPMTTAQLQAGLPPGFDSTIWAQSPSLNGGLPYLSANPPAN
jgi:hypothetical protein